MPVAQQAKRVGIVVVAYNAATTLAHVLDRIPEVIRRRIEVVLICDDCQPGCDTCRDRTRVQAENTGSAYRSGPSSQANLGYGGNQKAAYRWAIDHGLDMVVLLHGDGQYAPELMGDLLRPLEEGEADAVFGSRMVQRGSARSGGMPLYKYVGNRILTWVQNRLVGQSLSEWHSGYRAYSVDALRTIPLESNSDGFNFDTQIIIQLIEASLRIVEVPISTYYGNEICYVNGIRYAQDVVLDAARYRANKMGFGDGSLAFDSTAYELKVGDDSSHARIFGMAERVPKVKDTRSRMLRRGAEYTIPQTRPPRDRHRYGGSRWGRRLRPSIHSCRS